MAKVTILSGPQVGQVNLVPLEPHNLWLLAHNGWRWEVDYRPLSDQDALVWGRVDLMAKVVSALRRGGEVRFLNEIWRADDPTDLNEVMLMAQAVEDVVSSAGFYVVLGEDTEEFFHIVAHSLER